MNDYRRGENADPMEYSEALSNTAETIVSRNIEYDKNPDFNELLNEKGISVNALWLQ